MTDVEKTVKIIVHETIVDEASIYGYCGDSPGHRHLDLGSYNILSDDGAMNVSYSGMGQKAQAQAESPTKPATTGQNHKLTVAYTGPAEFLWGCFDPPGTPGGGGHPYMIPFLYFFTDREVQISAAYDW